MKGGPAFWEANAYLRIFLPQFSGNCKSIVDAHPLAQPGEYRSSLLEPLGSGVVRLNLAGAAERPEPGSAGTGLCAGFLPPRREEVRFREEWIPMERLYQEHFQIRRQADLIVE